MTDDPRDLRLTPQRQAVLNVLRTAGRPARPAADAAAPGRPKRAAHRW